MKLYKLLRKQERTGTPPEVAAPAPAAPFGELLQRLPGEGDVATWSGFNFRVLETGDAGPLKVELTLAPTGGIVP